MKMLKIIILSALLASSLQSARAVADDSCTEWSKQDDGTYFRTCVDENGHQYCQQMDADGHITTVSCT